MRRIVLSVLLSQLAALALADTKVSATLQIGSPAAAPSAASAVPAKTKGPPPWAPAHGRRAKHAYRYFPGQEVYQRPSDGMWFYLENGRWAMGARLPVGINVDVAKAVSLEMDTDRPFTFHADVRAAYSSASVSASVGQPRPAEPSHPHGKPRGKSKSK